MFPREPTPAPDLAREPLASTRTAPDPADLADRASHAGHEVWQRPYRVLYVVSHPIPYQEPMLQRLSRCPRMDLTVQFLSDFSVRSHVDPGFGGEIDWDVPLAQGYRRAFATAGKAPPNRFTGGFGSWIAAIEMGRYDAVWLHGYHHLANWRVAAAAKRRGIPLLLRGETPAFHDPTPRSAWRTRVLRRVAKSADAVLAIGSANARFWQNHGAPADRVFYVPYAIDNAWFHTRAELARPRRAALREELGLHPSRPVLLFVGKLTRRKRIEDAIRATAIAQTALGPDRRPQLLISGDGPDRGVLEDLARHHGDAASVRFIGFQQPRALPRLYDLADALLLPSEEDPWGLVVNEAMACGTAAIVSDRVGCGPDLVFHGRTGFVHRCGDEQQLARFIQHLCADQTLADQLGRSARSQVASFSFEADERGLLQALERVT